MTSWVPHSLSFMLFLSCTTLAISAVTIIDGEARQAPLHGIKNIKKAMVTPARTWMHPIELLVSAHDQQGLLYAWLLPEVTKPVGPFTPGKPILIEALAKQISDTVGARLQWINDIAVFEPSSSVANDKHNAVDAIIPNTSKNSTEALDLKSAHELIASLDAQGDSNAVAALSFLAGDKRSEVRLYALAAIERVENDFMRKAWRGRVSILEVIPDRIGRQELLFALAEGGATGGRNWKLAVELLGRARERLLARHIWPDIWKLTPGTIVPGMWALGRCGDVSGAWSMRGRIRFTNTNEPADRYLAAMALGQLGGMEYFERDVAAPEAEVRRAVAFGLGFYNKTSIKAAKLLEQMLKDEDAGVRFIACQSLARLGTDETIARLKQIAENKAESTDLRAAAMDALVSQGRSIAGVVLTLNVGDPSPAIRAQAATLLSDITLSSTIGTLQKMLDDPDRFVRCAALWSLARIGQPETLNSPMIIAADKRADVDERIAAILGLGRGYAPNSAAALGTIALDVQETGRLRQYAVLALNQLAQNAGRETLAKLSGIESKNPVALATRHLDLDTSQATAENLIPLLTAAERSIACAAAGRLAELGYGPATVELLEGSDVFDNHTRMMHCWGAVRSEGREVTLALAEASKSPRHSIRIMVALGLGGRLYPEAADALLLLLKDQNSSVRKAAAISSSEIADARIVSALADLAINDTNIDVARTAAQTLRNRDARGQKIARESLATIANSPRDPGGTDKEAPSVGTQSDNSFVLRAWSDLIEENIVCNLTYESSLCYDAYNGRIVQWGAHGRRYDTPQTGLTWFYDVAANRWTRLIKSRHWPNGTCCIRGTMYDKANKVVISPRSGGSNGHGWHNVLRANLSHSVTWVLDVTTDQWYAASPTTAFQGGFMPGSYDPVNGVVLWWNGWLAAYDAYDNTWSNFKVDGTKPEFPHDTGGVFDPQTGRFIAISTTSTWAFEPAKNSWVDLKPTGPHPPARAMVYDSANDVMLVFKEIEDSVGVWVYHLRQNRWEKLPDAYPCPSFGRIWDAAYDERNNVTVITGTSVGGNSATPNVRQTWTYRYKKPDKPIIALTAPENVGCSVKNDGTITVKWQNVKGVAKYVIERGTAAKPWLVKWAKIAEVSASSNEFTDTPQPKELIFYRVQAVSEDGKTIVASAPARTMPRIITQVSAVATSVNSFKIRWQPLESNDIVGYHIYRTPLDLTTSPWNKRVSLETLSKSMEKITKEPVIGTEFTDSTSGVEKVGNEISWPSSYAYSVRAVNAWGIESGPSPVALGLPEAPGPVEIVPWADGRRLVVWKPANISELRGFSLMRMDDWDARHVYRLHAAPVPTAGYWDDNPFPTGDRRIYHVSGIDVNGSLGIPTSSGWSHGLP